MCASKTACCMDGKDPDQSMGTLVGFIFAGSLKFEIGDGTRLFLVLVYVPPLAMCVAAYN